MLKKIFSLFGILTMFLILSCEPNTGTQEGKEAVEGDTLDPREGEGEGEAGPEEIGGYKHDQ